MVTNSYGTYDVELQMYVESPHSLNTAKLEYWRYLAQQPQLADDRDPHTAWCTYGRCAAGCTMLRPPQRSEHSEDTASMQEHLYGSQ
jgi:hypothetical protein